MKVFLSWSGGRSKAVAELLSNWLRCVLQAIRPWISTKDIDRGSVWFGEINDQLRETLVGIVCLTQDNKLKPWILFEAGALAKGLSTSRVCTFLIDLEPRDVEDPLAQFNHTIAEKASLYELVRTLNSALGDSGLDERTLEQVYETYWPQFESQFKKTLLDNPAAGVSVPRSSSDVMAEILENTRQMAGSIRRLELRMPRAIPSRGLLNQSVNVPSIGELEASRKNLIERMIGLGMADEKIVEIIVGSGDPRTPREIGDYLMEMKKAPGSES
jgi:hypothetical protein